MEKYRIKTEYNSERNENSVITYAKDKNDCAIDGNIGYDISTYGDAKHDDGGDNI